MSLTEVGSNEATGEDNPAYCCIGGALTCTIPEIVDGVAVIVFGDSMTVFNVVLGCALGLCVQFDVCWICSVT